MRIFLRRETILVGAMTLLAGCAGDSCQYLAFEETPESNPPLVMPEGVAAPAEGNEFRIPEGNRVAETRCLAEPPMTLDPEVLIDPEEAAEEGEETADEKS